MLRMIPVSVDFFFTIWHNNKNKKLVLKTTVSTETMRKAGEGNEIQAMYRYP